MRSDRQTSILGAAVAALWLFFHTLPAMAHEYWLEPVGQRWSAGEQLQADVRNGEEFVGAPLPFDPAGLSRAGLISDSNRQALTGRLGDYPAFQMSLKEPGLNLLLLETTQRELRYADFEDFETFLNYHGLQGIVARHQARGLPRENIVEHYYRYCKALIDVSDPTGQASDSTDNATPTRTAPALAPQDQRLELIAERNPMQADSVRLQLWFEGRVQAGRQVEMLYRSSDQSVTRTVADTNDEGHVEFTLSATGDYLFNSVKLVEPADTSAHWESHWASLFFRKN
ncbi:DUF4198 domain-containing protein [Granulosicoccus sp. 3-233]|uniref:DUF4198 domain-containing protein n=1 Tax=Granulosicoccus sp. 3-233 TaxID=3417969 RepID=UPI003D34EB0C